MAMKNNTKYAILGILSIVPGSGYDIKKYCDTVISNVWHENYGHIYPVLNTMLAEGVIRRMEEDDGSAKNDVTLKEDTLRKEDVTRKKVYEITEKGREEFMSWLVEPAQYAPVRSEFMLKFLFSNSLPKENILEMIAQYRERHERKIHELKQMEKDLERESQEISPERKRYLTATLRYGILSSEAAVSWCGEAAGMFD